MITLVSGSSPQLAKKSVSVRPARLPMLAKRLKPIPAPALQSSKAAPKAPLCEMKAMPPLGGCVEPNDAFMLSCVLITPRQFRRRHVVLGTNHVISPPRCTRGPCFLKPGGDCHQVLNTSRPSSAAQHKFGGNTNYSEVYWPTSPIVLWHLYLNFFFFEIDWINVTFVTRLLQVVQNSKTDLLLLGRGPNNRDRTRLE